MEFEQTVDEPAGLKAVERLDRCTEHLLGQRLHVPLVEVVFGDELEDELLLPVRAHPGVRTRLLVVVGCRVAALRTSFLVVAVHAVAGGIGQIADLLDLIVHALLEQMVQPGTFLLDLGEVREFGADADNERVTAEVGQPELLAVGCFQNDRHGEWLLSLLMCL